VERKLKGAGTAKATDALGKLQVVFDAALLKSISFSSENSTGRLLRIVEPEMHFSGFRCPIVEQSVVTGETSMTFTKLSAVRTTTDVVSGILNWICPECGGRMGGRGKEFKCQGDCQKDWRLIWERSFAVRRLPGLEDGPERLQASGVLSE
jgi:hypothetical protein